MKKENETEVFVDTTIVVGKVPIYRPVVDLFTLEKYKDRKSIADALLDDNFSNPILAKIAAAIQKEDEKERKIALRAIRHRCRYSDFRAVRRALDDKGYMYDIRNQIVDWKKAKAFARCYDRRIKVSKKKINTPYLQGRDR